MGKYQIFQNRSFRSVSGCNGFVNSDAFESCEALGSSFCLWSDLSVLRNWKFGVSEICGFVMERETVMVDVVSEAPVKAAGVKAELESGDLGINEKKGEKCSCVIDVKCREIDKVDKWEKEEEEMICRICHLSSDQVEIPTTLIQLGCGCKGELGVAHVHCGEAWFKLKGNRTCEICDEAATNITGAEDHHFIEEWEYSEFESIPETPRAAGCWRGQPFCNFLMACLVIAFVLPWFFRVNMF